LEKKLRVMVGYCMNKITPTNEIDKFNIDGWIRIGSKPI
jgi:hypothetical protein